MQAPSDTNSPINAVEVDTKNPSAHTPTAKKNVAMHPALSPFISAFQKRFETLQYQFEKTSSQHWQ